MWRANKTLPDGIAEAGSVRLGGLDQWVMIRGEDVRNPALIVLHGGPGFSDTNFLRHYVPELEKTFTVVYWDQRGTGRSYRPTIPRSSMTLAQFLTDLDELVEHVRTRLGKSKVGIFGHSWGTLLGALYAARSPEKVAVYLGVAQIGDWPATEARSYAKALAEAERQGKRGIVEKLLAIGPPPYGADAVFIERTCTMRLQLGRTPRALWNALHMAVAGYLGAPESSLLDLPGALRGFRFSMSCMWPEVSKLNLIDAVPALEVPVVFMVGGRDPWVPPETSAAYFHVLRAPSKQLSWFTESAHEPFVDEPRRFLSVMRELVLPHFGPSPQPRSDVSPAAQTPGMPPGRSSASEAR